MSPTAPTLELYEDSLDVTWSMTSPSLHRQALMQAQSDDSIRHSAAIASPADSDVIKGKQHPQQLRCPTASSQKVVVWLYISSHIPVSSPELLSSAGVG